MEKDRDAPPLSASDGAAPAMDPEGMVLVLDQRGRVMERHPGAPDLPPFPRLNRDRLNDYADRAHPVSVGPSHEYRALVVHGSPRGGYRVIARSTADVKQAITRMSRPRRFSASPS